MARKGSSVRMRAALLASALLAGAAVAPAPVAEAAGAAYTYTAGGTDTASWNDSSNWTPRGVPGSGDSVTIAPPSKTHCSAVLDNAPTVTLTNLTVSEDGPCDGTTSVGGGTLTVSGTFTWHGGRIATPLVLPTGSTGAISPGTRTTSAVSELDSTLDVSGTLNLKDDEKTATVDKSLEFGDAGTTPDGQLADGITVEPAGTLRSLGTDDLTAPSCCGNPARVVNRGKVIATADSLLRFDGAVLDQDGTLQTGGPSSEVDNFAGDAAEPNTAKDAVYSGPGTYRLSIGSAALTVQDLLTVGPGFRFVLGGQGSSPVAPDADETLSGNFTMVGEGEFDWLGGRVDGKVQIRVGTVRIGTTGTAGSNGAEGTPGETTSVRAASHGRPSTVNIQSAEVNFAPGADAATPNTMALDDGSTLRFFSDVSVPSYVQWSGNGHIRNELRMRVDAGGGSVYVGGSCTFDNEGSLVVDSGTVTLNHGYVQRRGNTRVTSAGRLRLSTSSSVLRVEHGELAGTGSIRGKVVNAGGRLEPGDAGSERGTLTVDGSYRQVAAHGSSILDLAKGSGDTLAVHGHVYLHGRLVVHTHYHPKASTTTTIVTATTRPTLGLRCVLGGFTDANGHARHWKAEDRGTSIVLTSVPGRGPARCR